MFKAGMCGAAFFPRGRARVKSAGQGGVGRGRGENPRGGAGRGEKARKLTNSQSFTKVRKWKYNITYYDINHKIDHDIKTLAENKYCIRNRDYDHPFLIIILE